MNNYDNSAKDVLEPDGGQRLSSLDFSGSRSVSVSGVCFLNPPIPDRGSIAISVQMLPRRTLYGSKILVSQIALLHHTWRATFRLDYASGSEGRTEREVRTISWNGITSSVQSIKGI